MQLIFPLVLYRQGELPSKRAERRPVAGLVQYSSRYRPPHCRALYPLLRPAGVTYSKPQLWRPTQYGGPAQYGGR